MSLYNILFGQNPAADILLAMLGLTRADCGRYRDCYPNEDGTEIIIHTRNGGGNREDYEDVFHALAKHPNYLGNRDDDFDCTYADIRFCIPEKYRNHVKAIADATDTTPAAAKWQKLLGDMESGKDTAVVTRAAKVGEQIMKVLTSQESQQTTEIKTPDGSLQLIKMKPENKD